MTFQVAVAPEAAAEFAKLSAWWEQHRPESKLDLPRAFDEALEFLASTPMAQPKWRFETRYLAYRFDHTPYFLLYRVDEEAREVFVVAAWSLQRGEAPPYR
ncbi:MAG: type II toxin-antitoxin system RelE/ParE family toxin [Deltaproteobacteria bacterium]|nr:type II toxin-antitoxin system RelE/ParE family toxin [Deltaproteobacteria bacterium]